MIGSIFPGFHKGDVSVARIPSADGTGPAEPGSNPIGQAGAEKRLRAQAAVRSQNHYAAPAAQASESGSRARPKPLCWTDRPDHYSARPRRPKPLCWTDRPSR